MIAFKNLPHLPLLATALILLLGSHAARADEETPLLRTVTFNLRYASNHQPNAWPDRRPVLAETVRRMNPDVIGTQEGLYHQIREIDEDLPDMTWIGLGRQGGSRGEFMAVFYRPDRLEPLEFDHFWLSDTPDVIGSTTWGNVNRRMVTWIRFRDLENDRQFFFVNTHFDHEIQRARELSARLLRERIAAFNPELPVIVAGDFNAVAGANPVHDFLLADGFLQDSWETATRLGDETVNTFHGFRTPAHTGSRIDWILYRGPLKAVETEIVTFASNGQYPSDHFPVLTTFEWEPSL